MAKSTTGIRKAAGLKSWLIYLNFETNKLQAVEDLHDGSFRKTPPHLGWVGFILSNSEKEAIDYVSQRLPESEIQRIARDNS